MSAWISRIVSKLVRFGRLRVEFHDGSVEDFGDGTGPQVAVRFADKAALWDLLRDPELRLGELYMEGRLLVTQGDLYDLLAIGSANLWRGEGLTWVKVLERVRDSLKIWKRRNSRWRKTARARSRRNLSRPALQVSARAASSRVSPCR